MTKLTLKNDVICSRQVAFAAAFLLPVGKLLEAPSLLAEKAAGDLLFPAILHFFLQAVLLFALVYLASKSEKSIFERLELRFGKGIAVFYLLYAVYFVFAAVLPVFDLEKFIYAHGICLYRLFLPLRLRLRKGNKSVGKSRGFKRFSIRNSLPCPNRYVGYGSGLHPPVTAVRNEIRGYHVRVQADNPLFFGYGFITPIAGKSSLQKGGRRENYDGLRRWRGERFALFGRLLRRLFFHRAARTLRLFQNCGILPRPQRDRAN